MTITNASFTNIHRACLTARCRRSKDCGKSLAAVLKVDHAVAGRNCAIADEVERKRLA